MYYIIAILLSGDKYHYNRYILFEERTGSTRRKLGFFKPEFDITAAGQRKREEWWGG